MNVSLINFAQVTLKCLTYKLRVRLKYRQPREDMQVYFIQSLPTENTQNVQHMKITQLHLTEIQRGIETICITLEIPDVHESTSHGVLFV